VADFVIWLFVTVMTPAEAVPESYQPTSPLTISILCCALLAIYRLWQYGRILRDQSDAICSAIAVHSSKQKI
jgi:hypothetical protein